MPAIGAFSSVSGAKFPLKPALIVKKDRGHGASYFMRPMKGYVFPYDNPVIKLIGQYTFDGTSVK